MKPDEGAVTDAGFADVLEFCATPPAMISVTAEQPVAVIMSAPASPRFWNLDPIEVEADLSDHTAAEICAEDFLVIEESISSAEVPVEILALAVNAPLLAVLPADFQADSFRRAGGTFDEASPWNTSGNDVANFPLRSQAVADAEAPFKPAPDALVDSAEPMEKIAAVIRAPLERPNPAAGGAPDNKFLSPDAQKDARALRAHGTGRAKSPADMPATPDSISSQTAFTPPRAEESSANAVPFVAPSSASAAVTSSPASPASPGGIAERPGVFLPVTDPTAVVRELAELSHEIRLRERGSVEVKFEFKDASELSVRLAYRDGDVHATFRTDSDDLRAALASEWQGFVTNVAREPGNHRIADPVFTGSNDFTDSSLGRDSGSAAGGDARDRWQASHPDQAGSARSVSPARDFRPQAPALGLRVSSDRLLHAFA